MACGLPSGEYFLRPGQIRAGKFVQRALIERS
jgi:hypothetical protein